MRSAFRTSTINTGTWSSSIDRLSAALVDALDSDAILARLNDLVRYAEFHFAAEELLMEQHQVRGSRAASR